MRLRSVALLAIGGGVLALAGVAPALADTYTYDAADNRTAMNVTGSGS